MSASTNFPLVTSCQRTIFFCLHTKLATTGLYFLHLCPFPYIIVIHTSLCFLTKRIRFQVSVTEAVRSHQECVRPLKKISSFAVMTTFKIGAVLQKQLVFVISEYGWIWFRNRLCKTPPIFHGTTLTKVGVVLVLQKLTISVGIEIPGFDLPNRVCDLCKSLFCAARLCINVSSLYSPIAGSVFFLLA